jgi:hypothetical protein
LADFVYQTDWQAKNKSVNNTALIDHTSTYSLTWFGVVFIVYSLKGFNTIGACIMAALFSAITFVVHTATDYITSRCSKKYFDAQNYHNGFLVIGFDQILHYLQLYYTYKLLS